MTIHQIVHHQRRPDLHHYFRTHHWGPREFLVSRRHRVWRHRRVRDWSYDRWYRGHCLPRDVVSVGFDIDIAGFGLSLSRTSSRTCWHYRHNPYYFHDSTWFFVDPHTRFYAAYYARDPYRHTYTPAYDGTRIWYRPTAYRLAQRLFRLVGGFGIGDRARFFPGYISDRRMRRHVRRLWARMQSPSVTRAETFQIYLDTVAAYADFRTETEVSSSFADEFEGHLRAMSYQYDYALRLYED